MIYAIVALILSAAFSLVLLKIVDGRFRSLEAARSGHIDILNQFSKRIRELEAHREEVDSWPHTEDCEKDLIKRLSKAIGDCAEPKQPEEPANV